MSVRSSAYVYVRTYVCGSMDTCGRVDVPGCVYGYMCVSVCVYVCVYVYGIRIAIALVEAFK